MGTAYIEVILPVNIAMNLALLFLCGRVAGEQAKWRRYIGASAVGSVAALLALFASGALALLLWRLGTSLLVAAIAWHWRSFKIYLKRWLLLMGITALAGGLALALGMVFDGLGLPENGVLRTGGTVGGTIGIACSAVVASLVLGKRAQRARGRFLYPLRLWVSGKAYECTALLDTGNSLAEPISALPVVLANPKVIQRMGDVRFTTTIPYHTIGESGMLKGMLVEGCDLLVEGQWHRAGPLYVACGKVGGNGDFEALLPASVMQ